MLPTRVFPRSLLAACALAALFTPASGLRLSALDAGGGQQPTFRTQVNLVQVDVVALDAQARFVADLRPEDFEVTEDGRPQRLVAADLVNIPIANADAPLFAAGRRAAAEVGTNERPFDGRLYLIVLDDLQVAANHSIVARRIAAQFIEKTLAPGDLAAVVTTSGNRKTAQGLTSDPRLLLKAVNAFVGGKALSPGAETLALAATPEADPNTLSPNERFNNARAALQTLGDLAAFAGRIRNRRKAVVLISEGIDTSLTVAPTSGQTGGVADKLRQVGSSELADLLRDFTQQANRANVTLYAFDPRVYTHGLDEFIDIASTAPDIIDPQSTESQYVKSTRIQDDVKSSQDNLRVMATETGGFAVTGSPMALVQGFERVRAENSNYYMLGYYASNEARDGKFRRIEVRVKRPGVRVVARRGYTAPKGAAAPAPVVETKEGTSPAVREALASVLPVSGFTLHAMAAPFKGTGSTASVIVVVQTKGDELKFAPKGDRLADSVELSVLAVDKLGKTRGGERFEVTMPLTQKNVEAVTRVGLVFHSRVALPPGQYQLRVAGRDAGSGRVGSVICDLEVPDFTSDPLGMSGLLVTAAEAGQVPNPRPDEELKTLLPASAIAGREFDASDELTLLAEVYDNKASQPHKVLVAATVQGDDGRVLFRQDEERSTSELNGARGGFGYVAKVPLRGLASGFYVLKVAARSTLNPDVVVSREAQFKIR
jgi:VWFA-related protein